MFWFSFLSCSFFPPQTEETSSSKSPHQLILLSMGSNDITETIASALTYKNIHPETIFYDAKSVDFAQELHTQMPNATMELLQSSLSPLATLPESKKTILIVSSEPQNLFAQSPSLQNGSYIVWTSMKDWNQFFESSLELISPLQEIQRFELKDVPEPSGLAIHPKTNNLWTVSDETGQVFDLGIQARDPKEPHSHEAFRIEKYEENDLEGIAFINGSTCVLVESERRLICYDEAYTEVSNQKIEGPYDPKKENKGPEGISDDGIILNEGSPTAIANTGRVLKVGSDVSGIEKTETHYWILSQSDGTITKLDHNFVAIHTYNFPDVGLEGISIWEKNLFLISDPGSILYQASLPQ